MPRIYNYNELSGEWEKSDGTLVGVLSGEGGVVESVNGKTGKVELTAEDVGALSENSIIPATADMTEPVGIGEDGKLKILANVRIDLLWKNAAPGDFLPQKIELDLSKYQYVAIMPELVATVDIIAPMHIYPIEPIRYSAADMPSVFVSEGKYLITDSRRMNISLTGIDFKDNMNDGKAVNNRNVPIFIFGIKGGSLNVQP